MARVRASGSRKFNISITTSTQVRDSFGAAGEKETGLLLISRLLMQTSCVWGRVCAWFLTRSVQQQPQVAFPPSFYRNQTNVFQFFLLHRGYSGTQEAQGGAGSFKLLPSCWGGEAFALLPAEGSLQEGAGMGGT